MIRKVLLALITLTLLWGFERLASAAAITLTGLVFEDANSNEVFDAGDKPLSGVVVSDGKAVVVTDTSGSYQIETDSGSTVFVSVPGTHHAPDNRFYRDTSRMSGDFEEMNFGLVRNADKSEDRNFEFVFVTDTHAAPLRNAPEGIRKAYEQITKLNPAFVIHGGDMILDALKAADEEKVLAQYELYTRQLAPIIKQPFYHTMGNHDIFGWIGLPGPARPPELYGKKAYERYFGPRYYSFNYKHCHFVVLDSVGRTKDPVDGNTYYGVVDAAQLDWLQKDLAKVDGLAPVILVTHIPTINALGSCYGLKADAVNSPSGEKTSKHQVQNFPALLGILAKGHNFKLALAGHYHTYEDIHWKTNEADAHFVVGGSVSGEWWKGDRAVGGATWPEGFAVVDVNGQEFKPNYVSYDWKGTEERE